MKKIKILGVLGILSTFLMGCDTQIPLNNINNGLGQNNPQVNNNNSINNNGGLPSNSGDISQEKAKEIALSHAGLSNNQVDFIKVSREFDNGREEYNIDFIQNGIEYDYDIYVKTGEIISYEHDKEYTVNPNINNGVNSNNTTQNAAGISQEKAKEIALKHAGLSSNQVTFIKVSRDFDNGREEYSIDFIKNGKEYDYDIDAKPGEIISYDIEGNRAPNINNGVNSNNTTQNAAGISQEKAKDIALNHSGLSRNQVTFGKIERDFDDGIYKYDIEFYVNGREYEYDIDANTGNILEFSID